MKEILQDLISKLDHTLLEIRIRSIKALQQKLEVGICDIKDLLEEKSFIPKVLSILQSDSVVLKISGIILVEFIIQNGGGRISFEALGGKQALVELGQSVPTHLEHKVVSLLDILKSKPEANPQSSSSRERFGARLITDDSPRDSFGSYVPPSEDYHTGVESEYFDDSCVSEKESYVEPRSPILFETFPWVPLTELDLRILDSTGEALVEASEEKLVSVLQVCRSTLFRDYPVEIFLQRPFILKVLLGHLISDPVSVASSWRVQERVCVTLLAFTRRLISRLLHWEEDNFDWKDLSSLDFSRNQSDDDVIDALPQTTCCVCRTGVEGGSHQGVHQIPPMETQHDTDDSTEFVLLKVHQITVLEWCCLLLPSCSELLLTKQPRLAASLFPLFTLSMRVMRGCIRPNHLWTLPAGSRRGEAGGTQNRISSALLQTLNTVSDGLVKAYHEARSSNLPSAWTGVRRLAKAFVYWVDIFSPDGQFDMVYGKAAVTALEYLLSDPCFYWERPSDHSRLLDLLSLVGERSYSEVSALVLAAQRITEVKVLLESPPPSVCSFCEMASRSLSTLFLHRSPSLVEAVVRGLALRGTRDPATPLGEDDPATRVLLQVLSLQDTESRRMGYACVQSLVSGSVGVSQAVVPRGERTPLPILFVEPEVVKHLVYAGGGDKDPQIVEMSRSTLLCLLRGSLLMGEEVSLRASRCFSLCLLHLQNLQDSETVLGKAVAELPQQLGQGLSAERIQLLRVKFSVKGLFSRDRKVRYECLRHCLALLVTSSRDYISVPPSEIDLESATDLFALEASVQLFSHLPSDAIDVGSLQKALQVLDLPDLDASLARALWLQLGFLLRHPRLHLRLEDLWPLAEAVAALDTMLRLSGRRAYVVSHVPFLLEVLRLRVSHSAWVRSRLAGDAHFLRLVLRAALVFRNNDQAVLEASLLLSLVLNEDVILERRESPTISSSSHSLSLPFLSSSSQHIPFLHSQHPWPRHLPPCPALTLLFDIETGQEVSSLPVSPCHFVKIFWSRISARDHQDLLRDFDYASSFARSFILSPQEMAHLRYSDCLVSAAVSLADAENATSHKAVKNSVNSLQALLAATDGEVEVAKEVLGLHGWQKGLARFFLCPPASAMDRQVLYHVMTTVGHALKLVRMLSREERNCLFCPMVILLVGELADPDSPLSCLLKETGTTDYTPSTPSPAMTQCFQLLTSLLSLASTLIHLSTMWMCKCGHPDHPPWPGMAENLANIFTLVIKKCKSRHNYNLTILTPTLECFVHLLRHQSVGGVCVEATPILIDLLMSFHVGRGRAHNAFVGRGVSLRALLALAFAVPNPGMGEMQKKVIKSMQEEVPSMPWLLSALEHANSSLIVAGLKVAISLSSVPSGALALDKSFRSIPGGIWTLACRYFCRDDLDASVRFSSCCVLLNLTSDVMKAQREGERPWLSLSLTDTLTGGSATGADALVELVQLFDLVPKVIQLLRGVTPRSGVEERKWSTKIEVEELKEFVSSEESRWASSSLIEEEYPVPRWTLEEFPWLLEASLELCLNLLLVLQERGTEIMAASGIGRVVVRSFAPLADDVMQISRWNRSLETGIRFLRLLGKAFCHSTHLSPLLVNVFRAEYESSRSLRQECLSHLAEMLVEGGWGAVRVLELLRESPTPLFVFLVELLHEDSDAKSVAASFVGALCKAAGGETPPMYFSALRDLLDTPLDLHPRGQPVCAGWELSRHLIQLLPSKFDSSTITCYSQKSHDCESDLKVFLECLKLLLWVSRSARECSFFLGDNLLSLFSFALSHLNQIILSTNIHITASITNKKELKHELMLATHCLQVATNWIGEPLSEKVEGGSEQSCTPLRVVQCLAPLLHPLWVPSLRSPPFVEAVVHFLITASSQAGACPVLTKTSVLPGLSLSTSRTRRSLLVAIATSVGSLLGRKREEAGAVRCANSCGLLPVQLLPDALDLMANCARVHETAYVISKEGFLKTGISFLESCKDLACSDLPRKVLQVLTLLTLHKEPRAALVKIPSWTRCLQSCLREKTLTKNSLLIFANMITNVPAVKNMLSTDSFLAPVSRLVTSSSSGSRSGVSETHLSLAVLWAMAANNQRGKAALKRLHLLPHLQHLHQQGMHPRLALQLSRIIQS